MVIYVPFPYSVMCPFVVEPRDSEKMYVSVRGTLTEINVEPGERVDSDELLVKLESPELEHQIYGLKDEVARFQIQLETLEELRYKDQKAENQIFETRKRLQSTAKALQERLSDQRRLELRAPMVGVVIPSAWMPQKEDDGGRLPDWSGTPLEKSNLGATLEPGVPVCEIGWLESMEANVVIDQSIVDFVEPGYRVELKFDKMPHDTCEGILVDVAPEEMHSAPINLTPKAGGDLATKPDPSGNQKPLYPSYLGQVLLGLYGHGLNYKVIRGKLENPEGTDTWTVSYLHPKAEKDKYGGRFALDASAIPWTYGNGDYIEINGQVGDDGKSFVVDKIRKVHEVNSMLRPGLRGRAKIHAKPQTLAQRAVRIIKQTFAFKL